MKVTKNLKCVMAYLLTVVLVISGMTGYYAKAAEESEKEIKWQCMGGSYWTGYATYPKHSDVASARTKNAVAYYIAEKSSDSLTDLYLSPSSDLNISMENGVGEEAFLTAGETIKFYIATGKIGAADFTEEDLAKTSGSSVNNSNKVVYSGSQNDKRKILTNAYTSMKVQNGDKYIVIWFRSGVPEGYYESITTWIKLASHNGKDIYYNVSLNGNEGYAGISCDETNINIQANSSAATYRSGRFYNIDGSSEALASDAYKNKNYALSMEKLENEGYASFYMAVQGTKMYGVGIDFKVVSEKSSEETSPEETSPEETSPEETSPEETSPEETSPEETSPEETSPEETSPEETSPEETSPEETSPEETSPEETSPEINYTFKDNGTVMPEMLDSSKTLAEQLPKELNLVATGDGVDEKEVTVVVSEWGLKDGGDMILGHYAEPKAVFMYDGKVYEYQMKDMLVFSSQLEYFVDCNKGSTVEFPAISKTVELVNGTVADQTFDNSVEKTWGYVTMGKTKALTSYPNGLYNTGYVASSVSSKITYKFWLENGTYKYTSGHCEWWGGGNKRSVKVTVSYTDKNNKAYSKEMGISIGNTTAGEQPAVSNYFTVANVDEGTYVTVTYSRDSGQAAAVAYIGIEKSLIALPTKTEGLAWSENEENPYHITWAAVDGADIYNIYVNNNKVGTSTTPEYTLDATLFEQPGDYKIGISAENITGESEKTEIIYTVIDNSTTKEPETSTKQEETTPKEQEETTPEESETPKGDVNETPKNETTTLQNETTNNKETKQNTEVERPGRTKVKTAVKKKLGTKVKISLKRVKGAGKYQIQISTSKKFKKKLVRKTVKKVKVTVKNKKLKNRKKLYIRARAVKIVGKKRYTGKWSMAKRVKIK